MDNIVKSDYKDVGSLIYEIRGQQVMLDSDLARLYECKNGTKVINQAVKRNPDRFPDDFCFQLTEEEYAILRSQIVTANLMSRVSPYVFTEQGVAMLATVLKTKNAAQMSIAIMRAFVAMRHYVGDVVYRISNVETKILEHDNSIKELQKSFDELKERRKDHAIFFNGQIYDAYSKIYEVFKEAKKNLIVIDNYADNTTLDIIKRLSAKVTIITSDKAPLSAQDIRKYNKQYSNLRIVRNNTFHDRYFIIDDKIIYHCGASVNYAGYKTFSITRLNDESIISLLRKKVATFS